MQITANLYIHPDTSDTELILIFNCLKQVIYISHYVLNMGGLLNVQKNPYDNNSIKPVDLKSYQI